MSPQGIPGYSQALIGDELSRRGVHVAEEDAITAVQVAIDLGVVTPGRHSTATDDAKFAERAARALGGGHEGLRVVWHGVHSQWTATVSTDPPRRRPPAGRWLTGHGRTPEAALRELRHALRNVAEARGVQL